MRGGVRRACDFANRLEVQGLRESRVRGNGELAVALVVAALFLRTRGESCMRGENPRASLSLDRHF